MTNSNYCPESEGGAAHGNKLKLFFLHRVFENHMDGSMLCYLHAKIFMAIFVMLCMFNIDSYHLLSLTHGMVLKQYPA